MYPTEFNSIDYNSNNQIKTGLELTKPTSGPALNVKPANYWNVFVVNNNTKLIVLYSDTCAIAKPCTAEGTGGGKTVTCGNDKFNVISITANTVTVLTHYKINPYLNNPHQNVNATGIAFSTTNYWDDDNGLKNKYGTSHPAYIYDKNSNLYQ